MATSRKHLIAALALALPVAALAVSPVSAATPGAQPKKHHSVHRVAHHKAPVHRVSAHHRVSHKVSKPQS